MSEPLLNQQQIEALIPHRAPFLLLSRVVSEDRSAGSLVAELDVRADAFWVPGHFPQPVGPIMPGVLIVEALAQAAGVLAIESLGLAESGKLVYFMAIDGAKFRTPVEPGCLLSLEVEFVQKRASVCKFTGRAMMDGKLAAEANFTAMIADPPSA